MVQATQAPFAVAVALVLALSACEPSASDGAAGSGDDAGAGQPIQVASSVFALAALADEIAPEADVELLATRGQDPHDLELSPRDRGAIQDADVVLHMGDIGFQPQVEQAVASATGEVVSVAEVVGDDLVRLNRDDHDGDEHDDGHDDHDGDIDPHVWLSPQLMSDVAVAIGEALAATGHPQSEGARDAAASVAETLAAIESEIDARLSDCVHTTALVGHEAWTYLLDGRGIEQRGISGAGGHGEASPRRLAELTDLIEERGIPGVFAEPVEGRDDAEALAAEAGVELYEVDPLGMPTDVEEWLARGYRDLLMDQVDAFSEGLRCQ